MSKLTRDGTAEPVSRDQNLRRDRGHRIIHFPCSAADHEQDWHPCPVVRAIHTNIVLRAARGGALPDFFFFFSPVQRTTSGIGHRVKYLVVFFGLATNALNVRNNKQHNNRGMLRRSRCVLIFL